MPCLVQQVDDLGRGAVKSYSPGRGSQVRPAEDVDRDQVDARLAHQRDVLAPDGRRPLLGVVVAAEADAAVLVARPGDAGSVAASGGSPISVDVIGDVCTCTDFAAKTRRSRFCERAHTGTARSGLVKQRGRYSGRVSTTSGRPRRATVHDVAARGRRVPGHRQPRAQRRAYVSAEARGRDRGGDRRGRLRAQHRRPQPRDAAARRPSAFIVHEPHSLFLEDPNIGAHHAGRQRGAVRRRPPDGQPRSSTPTATPSAWPATSAAASSTAPSSSRPARTTRSPGSSSGLAPAGRIRRPPARPAPRHAVRRHRQPRLGPGDHRAAAAHRPPPRSA